MIRVIDFGSREYQDKAGSFADDDYYVGATVEGNYRGRNWYRGKIACARPNGTFDILYDDGEEEMGVGRQDIRLKGSVDSALTPSRSSTSNYRTSTAAQRSYAISDID